MNRETMRMTFTFSIALAPLHIAAMVITTAIAWNIITSVGDCKNEFQTSVVSTSLPSPPLTAVWK